jgi:hypothetical protein
MPRPFWGPFWVAFWGPFWGPIRTGTPSVEEKPSKGRVFDSSFSTRQPSALRRRVESAEGSRGIACRRRPSALGEIDSPVVATCAGGTSWAQRPVASGVVPGLVSGLPVWHPRPPRGMPRRPARAKSPAYKTGSSSTRLGGNCGSRRRWLSTTASATSMTLRPLCCECARSMSNALSLLIE